MESQESGDPPHRGEGGSCLCGGVSGRLVGFLHKRHGAHHERPCLTKTRAGNDKSPLRDPSVVSTSHSLLGVEFPARFRLGGLYLNVRSKRVAVQP